ncbi:MAG: glucosamine-6-phosphate deaminase [Prevotella sp.]|nr:glucosamine-6-phosphate deaminase [Prevotella sp.]
MRLKLSSQIVLNKVPVEFYRPQNAVEQSELTRMEKIDTDIYASADEGARHIADAIEQTIREKDAQGQQTVLGLGTGLSLTPVFRELIRRHRDEGLSFRNVIVFNAYEYFPLQPGSKNSCIRQLHQRLLDHIDIKADNIHTPDGAISQETVWQHCRHYEQQIKDCGGIDVMLIGIGRLGNIATNEPGSTLTSLSRLILIDQTSRQEMGLSFGNNETVPPCSITLGIATILSAQKIFLAAWGEEKADILQKTIEEKMSDVIPASFLQVHQDAHVVIDLNAASRLTRIIHPWLVTSCQWTDKTVRSALVWLCQTTGKPLLKLTNKDYNENGLSELLALYGSAYNANIKVFNDLQHTITGWPGGKPNADDTYRPERSRPFPKRVVVFSPHPDDDVISMGGTIRKLVQQGHDVHIAYETSGNIAVGDEEVTRFMHFINGFNQLFGGDADEVIKQKYKEIKQFLRQKKDGDFDTRDVLIIKGLIRRGEARTACTYNQIPLDHVHFLDLPFYESGKIEKLPMGERDVHVVEQLLTAIQPHQIYVAGDLADPHGTHRKCTDAVLAAIDEQQQKGATWLSDCRVWMYRGAWAEWEIENIEMCVPMSPEELRAKRNSILKHASQMESAPFLGNDERLFWQRAEDRNRSTAALYHQLGLACYEAMEAFVEYKPQENK